MIRRYIALLSSSMVFLCAMTATLAETVIHKNKDTGLLIWSVEQDGFKIELIQLLPDFIRATYYKQDFPDDELDRLDNYCFFGTIIENKSGKPLYYNVEDWRYTPQGASPIEVKTKTQWIQEWRERGIRFNWTLLPTWSDFAPDDWQQGFTTIKIDRDQPFDFTYSWRIGETTFTNTIKTMTCAPATLAAP